MGSPLSWRDTLGALGVHIPSNVWLTNVSVLQQDGETGTVMLRGLTYDHPSTASWVTALEKVPGVSDVRVVYSAEETVDNRTLIRFEVRAAVAAGEPFEPLKREGD
jgi:Tfp pilus assembly protein PilN